METYIRRSLGDYPTAWVCLKGDASAMRALARRKRKARLSGAHLNQYPAASDAGAEECEQGVDALPCPP